jgi:hypothetical protein
MQADLILGFDPVPGDSASARALSDVLHKTVGALIEARANLESTISSGPMFESRLGSAVADIVHRINLRLSRLEDAVIDCRRAVEEWRVGLDRRQGEVAEIVGVVAELAGRPDAQERRDQLVEHAREIEVQHDRAAHDLAVAFEQLTEATQVLSSGLALLAADLDVALTRLEVAIGQWIEAESAELVRTALALVEVADLTTVVSELVGVAALGRTPGEADGVQETIARGPASHRLVKALRRDWLELAPESLPEASFGQRDRSIARIVAGLGTDDDSRGVG